MDEKDKKILEILKYNSKLSTQQISKKTNIPITTVHNRIKKMEKEGIIKKYTIEFDKKKLGINITAFILISIDFKDLTTNNLSQSNLVDKLSKMEEVESINTLAGNIDLMIKVATKDIDELNSFILNKLRTISGIEKTQTLVVLEDIK